MTQANVCCERTGCCPSAPTEGQIAELAYLKWLAATQGSPVSDEESQNFWLEAERELQSIEE